MARTFSDGFLKGGFLYATLAGLGLLLFGLYTLFTSEGVTDNEGGLFLAGLGTLMLGLITWNAWRNSRPRKGGSNMASVLALVAFTDHPAYNLLVLGVCGAALVLVVFLLSRRNRRLPDAEDFEDDETYRQW